jgi:1-aminocyclopropane-1-carboxylate deaminase
MIFQDIEYLLQNGNVFSFKVLREDLNHPLYQGNKFWKLKYNIAEAIETGQKQVLTFGGAYSNHIHATAAAGKVNGIQTIGVIRGEEPKEYSPTLQFAVENGMQLHFVSRSNYRLKENPTFIESLKTQLGDFFLIPEGGSNALGFAGCEEWGTDLAGTADLYCLAAGTATTAAGMAKALLQHQPDAQIWAFSALKDGAFLKDDAEKSAGSPLSNLQIVTDYHFGGYAKYNSELLEFIHKMESEYNLPLEQVYTGKTLFGLLDMAEKGLVPSHKNICFIHTGGMQGKIK